MRQETRERMLPRAWKCAKPLVATLVLIAPVAAAAPATCKDTASVVKTTPHRKGEVVGNFLSDIFIGGAAALVLLAMGGGRKSYYPEAQNREE
jgi:hypothetical protein